MLAVVKKRDFAVVENVDTGDSFPKNIKQTNLLPNMFLIGFVSSVGLILDLVAEMLTRYSEHGNVNLDVIQQR